MEALSGRGDTLSRLLLCGAAALVLLSAGGPVCTALHLPAGERLRPWLEEHPLQTAVGLTAVLFALSLLLFPPASTPPDPSSQEESPSEETVPPCP